MHTSSDYFMAPFFVYSTVHVSIEKEMSGVSQPVPIVNLAARCLLRT